MTTKTYDPGEVLVACGGNILGGFSEDGVVEVERAEASFTTHVGADGEVSRTRNRNKSGTIKVKLKQTSASNDILAAYLAADELAGTGIFPATVQDLLGTTLHFGSNAWVQGQPTHTLDKEEGTVEWTIAVGDLDMNVGGNVITAP